MQSANTITVGQTMATPTSNLMMEDEERDGDRMGAGWGAGWGRSSQLPATGHDINDNNSDGITLMKICERAAQDVRGGAGAGAGVGRQWTTLTLHFIPGRRQDHSYNPKHVRAGNAHRMSALLAGTVVKDTFRGFSQIALKVVRVEMSPIYYCIPVCLENIFLKLQHKVLENFSKSITIFVI